MTRNLRGALATLALIAALFAAGCDVGRLGSLNSDLVEAYESQLIERQNGQDATSEEARQRFASVSEGAYADAQKASDPKLKIQLYRIAATAAWQAGLADTARISDEGKAYCLGNNGYAIAPRDCSLLASIPALATNDATVLQMRKRRATAAEYGVAFDDLAAAYTDLGSHIDQARGGQVDPAFIAKMSDRRARIGRNISALTRDSRRTSREDQGATFKRLCRDLRGLAPPVAVPPTCR